MGRVHPGVFIFLVVPCLLSLIPAGLSVVQVLPAPDRITIVTMPKPS